MIAKNRDEKPDHTQRFMSIKPDKGYQYCGIFAGSGDSWGLKAGINEKGLVVVSATASTVSSSDMRIIPYARKLNERIMENFATVDEVLQDTTLLKGPRILMLGDSTKIAVVEIYRNVACRILDDGVLYHTNHYVLEEQLSGNKAKPGGSLVRYERIGELLAGRETLTPEDFLDFSHDQCDGPDHSIWRTGSTPSSTRTLASWIVRVEPGKDPELLFAIVNPGEHQQSFHLTLPQALLYAEESL